MSRHPGNNDGHVLTHKIGGELCQSNVLTVSPAIVEDDVLTLDKACFIETLADDRNEKRVDSGRTATEQSDHRNRTLLRTSSQRPRRNRASNHFDEVAPSHAAPSGAHDQANPIAKCSRRAILLKHV